MPIDQPQYKKILYMDLDNMTYEVKINADLWFTLGGIGLAYYLLEENWDDASLILTTGPLNGYFPYISKAVALYPSKKEIFEKIGGGSFGSLLNMAGIDGIVFIGQASRNIRININEQDIVINEVSEGSLVDGNDDLLITSNNIQSKNYFSFGNINSAPIEVGSSIGLAINSTLSIDLRDYYDYEKIYSDLLEEYKNLTVEPRNNPSCIGCPIGCDFSHEGEDDINSGILTRCLVSCGYADEIYKHIPTVFSCLNSIGYKYKHLDIEKLPEMIGEKKADLSKRFAINE